MLSKIQQAFSDPKQVVVAGAGILLFGFYALYARKEIVEKEPQGQKHCLELTLDKLINQQKNPRFKKIAITQTSLNHSNFTGEILSKIKAKLIANDIPTLVNCSPIKILSAGCQCFLETLSHEDAEDQNQYVSYYENSARCQLLVEKTIIDIQSIKKNNETVIVLCDNNTMDLKVRALNSIWEKFLSSNRINEYELMRNYDLVVHIQNIDQGNAEADKENKRIQEIWKPYPYYETYRYNHSQTYEQNLQAACSYIEQILKQNIPEIRSLLKQ